MNVNDIKKYLKPVVSINDNTSLDNALNSVEEFKFNEISLWVLTGKGKADSEENCLQIGQSEKVKEEITRDIKRMFDDRYSLKRKENDTNVKKLNTKYGEYLIKEDDSSNKLEYLYRYIKENYKIITFYNVDIDGYLGVDTSTLKGNIFSIYSFSKDYYAESKLAFEMKPKFWNYYCSGVGKRAFLFLEGSGHS